MIDLHTHSHCSDGELTPTALVSYAIKQGVKVLALTDHDCIDGVKEGMLAASEFVNLTFITGVELSVLWGNRPLHLVGLSIDINDDGLKQLLSHQQKIREERAKAIADKLADIGIQDAYEKASRYVPSGLVTRPHFARVLIDEGLCKNMATAFKRYLKKGCSAYVPTKWIPLDEGIEAINKAGGVAVLAHPKRYKLTQTKMRELITDFKFYGGRAIEVIAGMASKDEIYELSALCQKFDLLASVGSDFHSEAMTPHSMKNLRALPPACRSIMDVLV